MTGKDAVPESEDSDVMIELQQRVGEENRWRRLHRPQVGYFDAHPSRGAYMDRPEGETDERD